jgi:mannose-1-phosphate guanylyltransferase
MEPSVLDLIEPGRQVSVERETFPALSARGRLHGIATDDYWLDAGNPHALLQANLDRLHGRYDSDLDHPAAHGRGVDPSALVDLSATVVDSVVAAGVTVGPRTVVRRSVLLKGAVVGEDVTVEDSVVMGRIGGGARLSSAVIGADAEVERGRQVIDERIPEPAG